MEKPKVSVVMPIYNQAPLSRNSITSIVNQSFQDWELIIVNDGSDDTPLLKDIVGKFNDKRITLVSLSEHSGLVTARNFGCELTRADIICTQDADDLSLPDRLERCLPKFAHADVVYHGAYINMWDAQHQSVSRKYLPAPCLDKKKLLEGQNLPGWALFKKSVWREKPFRMATQYCYDWMMYLDWAFSGYRFGAIDYGLYEYVRHENSASIKFEKEGKRQESEKAIKKIMLEEYGYKI